MDAAGDMPERGSRRVSLLELVQGLKEQIAEKERELRAKSQALVEERRFIERMIESMNDAVFLIDERAVIAAVNPAACRLLEDEAEALLGAPASQLWARPEQRALFVEERLDEMLEGRSALRDWVLMTRKGAEVPVSFRCASVPDEDGSRRAIVGIARDMRVERRVQDEKLKAVRVLAASVAHEIRNPLGAIQNAAALLLRDLELQGDDRELLEIIEEESERISGIVTQFLRFARPPRTLLEPAELPPLIEAVLTLARRDERMSAGRSLRFEAAEGLGPVPVDGGQLRQVVWNLVSNALDAIAEDGAVEVRAAPASGGVIIEVRDDGPGVSAEALETIFEPFVTTKPRGTGLGLAICRAVMEAHGGWLTVENRREGGAQATLFLPEAPSLAGED